MFTSLGRFRRQAAVLTVLSLVASVLVVAAPAAAADPKADFKATFSACVGDAAGDAEFSDVPDGHANAADIDCIAYYGITKGTTVDGSTYEPLMSVTREQMALFLARLATRVGVSLSDGDTPFTDIGDLTQESQAAIGKIYAAGITKGWTDTTYAPASTVRRDHMALFIARLMDKMTPMADGKIGLSSTTQYGHTPADVAENKAKKDIGTPFTDLGDTAYEAYLAITRLWELGVAAGMSDTSYAPAADITRASMAGFMAGVLNHSNARPNGLTIQANKSVVWGDTQPVVVASYRSDTFEAVEGQAIDVFSSASPDKALRKNGTCNFSADPDDVLGGDLVSGDCVWDKNDNATDKDGNLYVGDSDVDSGTTRTFFAWIGSKDGEKFDTDNVEEKTVTVEAKHPQAALHVTSDINAKALNLYGNGLVVDLNAQSTVTFTVQLIDDDGVNVEFPTATGANVEREGVKIRVDVTKGTDYRYTHQDELTTDEKGRASFTIDGPARTTGVDDRIDFVWFRELDEDGEPASSLIYRIPLVTGSSGGHIHWIEEAQFLASDGIDLPEYVLEGSPSLSIRVNQFDQYGNPYRSFGKQKTQMTVSAQQGDDSSSRDLNGAATDGENLQALRQVISRGYASWSPAAGVSAQDTITVQYDVRQLARNSKGQAVRAGQEVDTNDDNDTTDPGETSSLDFAGWVGIGPSSASSRMTVIDGLNLTYNDGAVITDTATDTQPKYLDKADDDPDAGAIFLYSKPASGDFLRNILSSGALDTYQDYGATTTADTPAFKTAQGLVAAPAPSNSDGSGTVPVVDRASSADTNVTYNVDLVGSWSTATQFLADTIAAEEDGDSADPELVFSFDDEDSYIDNTSEEGRIITIATFRKMLKDSTASGTPAGNQVRVLTYNVDGTSTFSIVARPTG